MKLGILVPLQRHANAEFVRAYGETAESVGFDSLWIGEHVVITDDYASKFVVDLGDDKMHHKSAQWASLLIMWKLSKNLISRLSKRI